MDLIERETTVTDDNDTPSPEELADFKAQVNEWIKMDDQIKKLSIAIRERKVHLRVLSDKIQKFMLTYGYDNLNTNNQGRILYSCRKVKEPIKITEIKEKLLEKRHLTGEQLFKELFESDRPTKESSTIRRVIPKVSMNIDL